MAKSISIDLYVTLHNGSIASMFQSYNVDFDILDSVQVKKYEHTLFYKKFDMNQDSQLLFFKQTIISYENFIKYLTDPNMIIDYTYLWEVIGTPNINLFCKGYNLIIVEVFQNNDQVGILCPSNPYVTRMYQEDRRNIILLKTGELFNPMYLIRSSIDHKHKQKDMRYETFHILKTLSSNEGQHPIYNIIPKIGKHINLSCRPLHPNTYTFQHGINAIITIKILQQIKTNIKLK